MSEGDTKPSIWLLFRIWASIGLQSFGGGASTTFLIQRAFIEKYRWVTAEEFMRLWGLCLLAPGINLIAITVLLGKRLAGIRGIVVSLAGLLLPSSAITCLLAALFTGVEQLPDVQAVVRGVIPATAGIMMLVGLNFARPLFRGGLADAMRTHATSAILVLAAAVTVIVFGVSPILVVAGMAILGVVFFTPRHPIPPQQDLGTAE
jgi:chromate transporter